MNHKWKDNVCVRCGVARERGSTRLLMAITNHPPYNHYLYESVWFYSGNGMEKKTSIRPDCKKELVGKDENPF